MSDQDLSPPTSQKGLGHNLNIHVPPGYTESDVIFKINKPKAKPDNSKFRSFCIGGNLLSIGGQSVPISYLVELLQKHGLSKTLPINVQLGRTVNLVSIDWNPLSYFGPKTWYFDWNGTSCSIVGNNSYGGGQNYIRVHDLTPGLGERILSEICTEILKRIPKMPEKTLSIHTPRRNTSDYRWGLLCTRIHRDIDTIYIDQKVKDMLIEQLKRFFVSGDVYDRYGVTYKRIHLFHGPPGGGKTSTVLALASMFGRNIAKLTITPDLNSQHLETLFQTVPTNSFVLLEDVDALFVEREGNASIDFSTMLNCMDGIATTRGLVMFMTTNHIMKLDPAFMRPGRVDCCVEFKLAGREELHQALKLLGKQYEREHEEFLNTDGKDMTIAELQKHLFDCMIEERESMLK